MSLSAIVILCLLAAVGIMAWREHERNLEIAADDGMLRGLIQEFDRHMAADHFEDAAETLNRARGVRAAGHARPEVSIEVDRAAARLEAEWVRRPPPRRGGPPPPPPDRRGGRPPPDRGGRMDAAESRAFESRPRPDRTGQTPPPPEKESEGAASRKER